MKLAEFLDVIALQAANENLLDADVITVGTGQETRGIKSIKARHYFQITVEKDDKETNLKAYKD